MDVHFMYGYTRIYRYTQPNICFLYTGTIWKSTSIEILLFSSSQHIGKLFPLQTVKVWG